ncbi:MAG: hypothetical protein ACXABG_13570 [Promethearchaeota archaeon]
MKGDTTSKKVIPGFFKEINLIIDKIQKAMVKGNNKENMIRVVESENSTIIIIFHPPSRILFCSIADPDDDVDKTIEVIHKISSRFWKKHQSDISMFRTTSEKSRFQTIIADIENISQGGKIAEVFPKLLVVKKVLEKIMSMGMINETDFQVAIRCTGDASPLRIARMLAKPRNDVNNVLKKLEELDIVNF